MSGSIRVRLCFFLPTAVDVLCFFWPTAVDVEAPAARTARQSCTVDFGKKPHLPQRYFRGRIVITRTSGAESLSSRAGAGGGHGFVPEPPVTPGMPQRYFRGRIVITCTSESLSSRAGAGGGQGSVPEPPVTPGMSASRSALAGP